MMKLEQAIQELAAFGRFASARGWLPATAGNFSARLDDGRIAITRSGVDKGNLTAAEIAVLELDEPIPSGTSAETPLHMARYRADASIGAVFHVHTVAATVLSRAEGHSGSLAMDGFEMLKSLAGVETHESWLAIPIFANSQDMPSLAREIEHKFSKGEVVPAYLLEGHGLYTWGRDVFEARRHVEGIEFLLQCALEERRIKHEHSTKVY